MCPVRNVTYVSGRSFTKGESPVAPECVVELVGRLLFSVIILAGGRTRTSKGMRFWSDQLPHSATINLGLCDDVRSTPPFLPPAISDRKIRFPGNREPWFWRCRRNKGGHSQIGSR